MSQRKSSKLPWLWPAMIVLGVFSTHLLRNPVSAKIILPLAIIAALALGIARFRPIALALLAACWTLVSINSVLDRRPSKMTDDVVEGRIVSLPQVHADHTRFVFSPDQTSGPGRILVSWYRDPPQLMPGERWQFDLRIKPPWGSVNFQGSDKERWLFSQRIDALGSVRQGTRLAAANSGWLSIEQLRAAVSSTLEQKLPAHQMAGIIRALAIADRSQMTAEQRDVLKMTGTTHLLAISGLHIGLAALGGLWLGTVTAWCLPWLRTGRGVSITAMITAGTAAALYAALAALQVATIRSVVMLSVLIAGGVLGRSLHPGWALTAALALVLLIDPLVPITPGFWFSFLAVASLLFFFTPRRRSRALPMQLLMAQCAVMVVLTPVTAYWFQSFSLSGLLANLFAIPWVSFTVVPLVLLGIAVMPLSTALSAFLWWCAAESASALFVVLSVLSEQRLLFPDTSVLEFWQVALGVIGGTLLLLPRALYMRSIGLALLIPLFLPVQRQSKSTDFVYEVLDAGQGTASVLSSRNHSMIYDTGTGDGGQINIVGSTILPALRNGFHQRAPGLVIVSHGDLDHAGGLVALQEVFPQAEILVNRGRIHGDLCHTPLQWAIDNLRFNVLHPSTGLPYLKNDSSCVISMQSPNTRVLLAGDISKTVEQRLLAEGLAAHDILLVPHHGSTTSSGSEFVQTVDARYAVATTRLGNRFGFPRDEVVERYRSSGTRFLSTAACGALRFVVSADGELRVESARRVNQRVWRWPAAPECP